jgi:hypothetical protein
MACTQGNVLSKKVNLNYSFPPSSGNSVPPSHSLPRQHASLETEEEEEKEEEGLIQ